MKESLTKRLRFKGNVLPISEFIDKRSGPMSRINPRDYKPDGKFPDWNTLRQRAKAKWASS